MIASIWGRESGGRMTYNAVKAAEISLAKSMAQQLARDNIRVNSVAPGSILFPGWILAPASAGGSGGHRRLRAARAAVRTLRPRRRSRRGRRVSRLAARELDQRGQRARRRLPVAVPDLGSGLPRLRDRQFRLLIAPWPTGTIARVMSDRAAGSPATAVSQRGAGATARSTRRSTGWRPVDPPDRPDSPDLHVTAVRRLPAVAGQYAPFPDGARRAAARRARVARRLAALHASGRGDRPRARRPPRRRHHADGVGQDALLQRAGSALDPSGSVEPRAVSLSDEGARAGPARRAAGACARRSTRRPARRSACSPTTATRRRTRGERFARARTSCSAIPTWCTRASCRTIRAGRSCSRTSATSSSTSCTPIAACSAATCATCCGGCAASAGTTDPIRCSSARRRRSPTRASWPSGSPSSRSSWSIGAARRAARSSSSSSIRRSSTISSASGART